MGYLIIILVGLILIGAGAYKRSIYKRTDSWIRGEACLLDVRIAEELIPARYGNLRYSYPRVTYSYSVGGNEYRNSKVSVEFMNTCVHEDYAPLELWFGWSKDQRVPLFYNPENPSESVLIKEPTANRRSHYMALFAAGTLIIAFGLFLGINF
jgi:hypothetical protein